MGYAPDMYELVSPDSPVPDDSDDQLYYTRLYLNQELRQEYGMLLDSQCKIFQTLNNNAGKGQWGNVCTSNSKINGTSKGVVASKWASKHLWRYHLFCLWWYIFGNWNTYKYNFRTCQYITLNLLLKEMYW